MRRIHLVGGANGKATGKLGDIHNKLLHVGADQRESERETPLSQRHMTVYLHFHGGKVPYRALCA